MLVSDTFDSPSNKELLRPPAKGKNPNEVYDSVSSGGSIFIVYNNDQVYPAYLITYKG